MVCNKCGYEISSNAQFCPKCGYKIERNNAIETDVYILTINRAKQWFAINPSVKIIVDEHTEYRIGNGKTISITIPAGVHTIGFFCGIRNKIVDINMSSDLTINIKWNRLTGSLVVK